MIALSVLSKLLRTILIVPTEVGEKKNEPQQQQHHEQGGPEAEERYGKETDGNIKFGESVLAHVRAFRDDSATEEDKTIRTEAQHAAACYEERCAPDHSYE